MEKFFEEGTLSDTDILSGLKQGIVSGKLFPVLFGSAARNAGVKVMLDFATEYLPSPDQVAAPKLLKTGTDDLLEIKIDAEGTPLAYVFKIASEGHLGDMSYFKSYSGTIKTGQDFNNQQLDSS